MKGSRKGFAPQVMGRVAPYPRGNGMAPRMMPQPMGHGTFCTNCGAAQAPHHLFCSGCGTRRVDAGGCAPMMVAPMPMGFLAPVPMMKGSPKGGNTPLGGKPGDWECLRCGDVQFARNTSCRKCGAPKLYSSQELGRSTASLASKPSKGGCSMGVPKGGHPNTGGASRVNVKPGDWECPNCKDVQFSRNSECRKCGTPRPAGSTILPPKEGDWICPGCGDFQFGHNTKCRQCGEPKPDMEAATQEEEEVPLTDEEVVEEQLEGDVAEDEAPVVDVPSKQSKRPVFKGLQEPPSKRDRKMKPGDWECPGCGDVNFARNATCRKCNHECPEGAGNASRMQPGDWLCPNCGDLQFARNTRCRKCRAERPDDYVPAV